MGEGWGNDDAGAVAVAGADCDFGDGGVLKGELRVQGVSCVVGCYGVSQLVEMGGNGGAGRHGVRPLAGGGHQAAASPTGARCRLRWFASFQFGTKGPKPGHNPGSALTTLDVKFALELNPCPP